jgi:soluble epoxide hydrolase/lipid-phosphate phosphatase
MDQLTKKTFTTSRDLTYTYYHHPGTNPALPTLLLQHGFPDDHSIWAPVLPYLLELPYPIIAPDLLGYGGTSKPADAQSYNSKGMSTDLIEIIDHEKIQNIVSIGHDWGAFLAGRMWVWHPSRVVAVIILNVAYSPPSKEPFNLTNFNDLFEKLTGLPRFSYFELFAADYAVKLLEDNLETMYSGMHGDGNALEDLFCHRGALEKFLRKGKQLPVSGFASSPAMKEAWISRLRRDGFTGPLNWYKAQVHDVHLEVEKDIPVEGLPITVPVLFIGASKDKVTMTQMIYVAQQAGVLPDLKIEEVESGHWQTLEVPDKTGPIIAGWLKEKEGVLGKAKI